MKKDSVDHINLLEQGDENYSLIGQNFKFTFPFPIFDSVSKKIQENIDEYFEGDGRIVDWCMNHVGYSAHARQKKLYKGIMDSVK